MAGSLLKDVLTVQWLKEQYLAGVVLTDLQGVAFPDSIYETAIAAAVRDVENILDYRILPLKVGTERHPLTQGLRDAVWQFMLRKRPLRTVNSMVVHFGNLEVLQIPVQWLYTVMPKNSMIHIIPVTAGLEAVSVPVPILWTMSSHFQPGTFDISYDAGIVVYDGTVTLNAGVTTAQALLPTKLWDSEYSVFYTLVAPQPVDAGIVVSTTSVDLDRFDFELSAAPANNLQVRWVACTLPEDLRAFIGLKASLQPLNIAGTTLLPAGFASGSVSEDGLSQSITSTQNAQVLAYNNRAEAHRKIIAEMLPQLRGKYRSMDLSIM